MVKIVKNIGNQDQAQCVYTTYCGISHERTGKCGDQMQSLRSHHVCMERKLRGNELFGGHRNPEQRLRPRMSLSSCGKGVDVKRLYSS